MKSFTLILTIFILSACGHSNTAIELEFSEQEAGGEPYKTRMIVTDNFLRIDDGPVEDNNPENEGDFILFDRKARKISSIAHENGRVFEILFKPITQEKPTNLAWEHKTMEAKDAPTIEGIKPTGHSFSANKQTCLQTMSAKGLLEKARQALIEYQTVLSGEHSANLDKTPKDQRQPCDTALSIFHATDSLQYGFPIIEWDSAGHRRQLTNYTENVEVDNELFKIPKGFTSFSVN